MEQLLYGNVKSLYNNMIGLLISFYCLLNIFTRQHVRSDWMLFRKKRLEPKASATALLLEAQLQLRSNTVRAALNAMALKNTVRL